MMAVTGRCLLGAGQRLAGEHGFVNAQAVDVEQAQVGGDLVARLQQHLAGHDLARSALEGCSHRQVRYEAHSNTGVDTVADMTCALLTTYRSSSAPRSMAVMRSSRLFVPSAVNFE